MCHGFGEDLRVKAYVDAQATIELRYRPGFSKSRHIESAELWIQDALEHREFALAKIHCGRSHVDILTTLVP